MEQFKGQRAEHREQRTAITSQKAEVRDQTTDRGIHVTEPDWQRTMAITKEVDIKNQYAQELIACQKAYELAMNIYTVTKTFPRSEQYVLTDQIRRSSRAVCACLAEAWEKRRYEAHFISKLTDADAENNETAVWLDFAPDCGYLASPDHQALRSLRAEVGAMLGGMLRNPTPFLLKH